MPGIRVTTHRYTFQLVREAEAAYPVGSAVNTPRDAVAIAQHVIGAEVAECLIAVFLDGRHRVTGYTEIARGTLNASRFVPRDILIPAFKVGCGALVLAHNHPSGCPEPSVADRRVTRVLREATELVGLTLLDHLIVTDSGYYSFREAEQWDDNAS